MNCEQMTALLSAYMDGELTAAEQVQVRAHLEQCPECWALYEQLMTLHTSFSDLEEISAPENFAQGVMARIRAEENPKVIPLFKRPQVRAVMGLAACALLCIGFGRVALDGSFKNSSVGQAAPAAAPGSAVYDAAEYSVQATSGSSPEARIDGYAMPEMPAAAPEMMEPAACEPSPAPAEPAPEMQADSAPVQKAAAGGEIVLSELPEELEDAVGPLQWEERIRDGALCARLTREQALLLMELVREKDLPFITNAADEASPDVWTLILEP